MEQNKKNAGESIPTNAREQLLTRLLDSNPACCIDNDEQLYEALLAYDNEWRQRYETATQSQRRLAEIIEENPRIAAFIGDILSGDDAMAAVVRHFGKVVLDSNDDNETQATLNRENEEYNRHIKAGEQVRHEMEENWQHSARAIARFKKQKGLSDDDFEDFMQQVEHLCEHVFMHNFTPDILDRLYKGMNYERDMAEHERVAEIRGRNERIDRERLRKSGDNLPHFSNTGTTPRIDGNRTPAFGHTRRRSVWDM